MEARMAIATTTCMRRFLARILPLLILTLAACEKGQQPVDTEAEALLIERLHGDWADAEVAKDVDASLAFMTDDAVLQPPNAPPIQGREAIRDFYIAMFELPIVSMTMGPTTVVVSESGDVAADWGILTLVLDNDQGPVTDTLKFMAVWERHDGAWKVAANSWSSNAPH